MSLLDGRHHDASLGDRREYDFMDYPKSSACLCCTAVFMDEEMHPCGDCTDLLCQHCYMQNPLCPTCAAEAA